MKTIGILGKDMKSYEVKRLMEEGKKLANVVKIDYRTCCHMIHSTLDCHAKRLNLRDIDVIIPRVTFIENRADNTEYRIMTLRFLEAMGIPMINSVSTMTNCQNKFITSMLLKKKNVAQPECSLALKHEELLKKIQNMKKPLVIKLLTESVGRGVAKINSDEEAEDWFEAFEGLHQPLYIQEYIENPGEDYRVFILGDKIIGAMRRTARKGTWKSNVSLGGKAEVIKAPKAMKELALKAQRAIKARQCGVDIVEHHGQYKVIEINHNPGFKGLERATGKNIAREIIRFSLKLAK